MQLSRLVILLCALGTLAACSGSAKAPQCNYLYVGSAGAVNGVQVSPSNGSTAVPLSTRTFVFLGSTDRAIVLKPANGASTITTAATALPSPYRTSPPGTGSNGYYAVSANGLQAGTTYATGTLTDNNECAGDYRFYQFGTFTTQ